MSQLVEFDRLTGADLITRAIRRKRKALLEQRRRIKSWQSYLVRPEHEFAVDGWVPWQGEIKSRNKGSMVADRTGVSTSNAIMNLQDRGVFFIDVGEAVYEGMIIGELPKPGDLDVNICKEKKHTNVRAVAADETVRMTPPKILSLEQSLEFIGEDEAIEVTPDHIRLRKVELDGTTRLRKTKNLKKSREAQ